MTRFPVLSAALLAACAAVASAGGASAQVAGCELRDAGDGRRQVLRCGGGVSAEVERGAEVRVIDANRDGTPEALDVQNRAVLVDYERGRRGFQVLTPHAIAAVRGTTWVVAVEGGRTSVFVVGGEVAVGRAAAGRGVVLRPGQGVDVDAGSGPLRATTWSRERAAALLARFGR